MFADVEFRGGPIHRVYKLYNNTVPEIQTAALPCTRLSATRQDSSSCQKSHRRRPQEMPAAPAPPKKARGRSAAPTTARKVVGLREREPFELLTLDGPPQGSHQLRDTWNRQLAAMEASSSGRSSPGRKPGGSYSCRWHVPRARAPRDGATGPTEAASSA